MKILRSGTRDVEILAPLKIKCLQTTIENGVIIGGSQSVEANGLFVSNNAIINRNLTVNNNLTVNGTLNVLGLSYKPWHVAGRVDGATLQILSNKGEYPSPSLDPLLIQLVSF